MSLTRRLDALEQQTAKQAPTVGPPCRLVLTAGQVAAVEELFAGIGENIPPATEAGPLAVVSWCGGTKE